MSALVRKTWNVKDARSRFSDLLDAAERGEPQRISRRGKTAFLLVSEEEWRKATRATAKDISFAEHLMAFPGGIDFEELRAADRRTSRVLSFDEDE